MTSTTSTGTKTVAWNTLDESLLSHQTISFGQTVTITTAGTYHIVLKWLMSDGTTPPATPAPPQNVLIDATCAMTWDGPSDSTSGSGGSDVGPTVSSSGPYGVAAGEKYTVQTVQSSSPGKITYDIAVHATVTSSMFSGSNRVDVSHNLHATCTPIVLSLHGTTLDSGNLDNILIGQYCQASFVPQITPGQATPPVAPQNFHWTINGNTFKSYNVSDNQTGANGLATVSYLTAADIASSSPSWSWITEGDGTVTVTADVYMMDASTGLPTTLVKAAITDTRPVTVLKPDYNMSAVVGSTEIYQIGSACCASTIKEKIMNHKYLSAASLFILGTGCIALTKQQKSQQPNLQVNMGSATNITGSTENPDFGSAASWASLVALRHSNEIARKGQIALNQKRYSEAETLFRKAVAVQPENSEAWLLLAEVCERQGKLQEALQAYYTLTNGVTRYSSITFDPTTRMRYVLALVRSNRYADAVAVYDLARKQAVSHGNESLLPLRFDANNPDENRLQAAAHYVMGIKHPEHHHGTLSELRQHLDAAIRFAPDWGKPYAAIGKMLEWNNHPMEAEGYYTKSRNLGEPVESYKQATERTVARMRREHDLAHPEIHQSNGVMIPIKLNNAQIKELIPKSQVEVLRNTQQLEAAKAAKKAKEGAKSTIQGATIPGQPKL